MSTITIEDQRKLDNAPETVEFNLEGFGSIHAARQISKAGNVWFRGQPSTEDGRKANVHIPGEPKDVLAALPKWAVGGIDVVELNAKNPVHVSEPRRSKTTGLPIAGTGGNLTVTHSGVAKVAMADGTVQGFTAMATVTNLKDKESGEPTENYAISVKLITAPTARPAGKAVGHSTGFAVV